jgi:hypothetical protein
MSKILVIPDCQVKTGVPLDHLSALGNYIVSKKPDTIVQIGDFADLPSLSSYDIGKRCYEGRRYTLDIEAARGGMETLLKPLNDHNEKASRNHEKQYHPRKILTLGNHENRITRATDSDAKLEGTLSLQDLGYEKAGWEVYPFLQPVIVEGVVFNHYFPSGIMGRPIVTAQVLLRKMHMSCIAGHLPGLQFHREVRADGKQLTAVICGSFYQHTEEYMSPMVNKQHWQGVIMLHNVNDGDFDIMPVSLRYLMKKYV